MTATPAIEIEIEARLRRKMISYAIVAVLAATLAIACTLAVRYEIAVGPVAGGVGILVGTLEVIFIAGIIPLVVSAVYFGASATALSVRLKMRRHPLPAARARH